MLQRILTLLRYTVNIDESPRIIVRWRRDRESADALRLVGPVLAAIRSKLEIECSRLILKWNRDGLNCGRIRHCDCGLSDGVDRQEYAGAEGHARGTSAMLRPAAVSVASGVHAGGVRYYALEYDLFEKGRLPDRARRSCER